MKVFFAFIFLSIASFFSFCSIIAPNPFLSTQQRNRNRADDCEGDQYATRNSQGVITACTSRIPGIRGRKGMRGYPGGYAGNAGY